MKILQANNSRFNSFQKSTTSSRQRLSKKRNHPEFKFRLDEILNEDSKEWDEYSVLLPRHGHFWDNGYEDVEKGGKYDKLDVNG